MAKLGNIILKDSSGTQRGQLATGTTDTNCLNVKALDENGVLRDIQRIQVRDSNGNLTTITKKLTATYGDKQLYFNVSGSYGAIAGSNYNLNQNAFHFYAYCTKDVNGDRLVANFGNTTNGWAIWWLGDGRIRWTTYYGGTAYHSYSSNYVYAGTWAVVRIDFDYEGTGNGVINFNGVTSTANRYGRHQYPNLSFTLGTWGMLYRGYVHVYGINSGGGYVDTYVYINNFTVMQGTQSSGALTIYNSQVTQDTSFVWS